MNKNIFLFLYLSTLFFVGCDKDNEDTDILKGEPVSLNVIMGTIDSFGEVSTRSANTVMTFTQPLDSTIDTGIDVITTVEQLPETLDVQTRASVNNQSRFRMIVYDAYGNTVATTDYIVNNNIASLAQGQKAPVLNLGTTYKFFFYTYNSGSFEELENGKTPVFTWDDFATYVITKTITAQDNSVTVNFMRHCCKFELVYTASGFMNNTVTLSGLTSLIDFGKGLFPIDSSVSNSTNLSLDTFYPNHVYYGPTYVVPINKRVGISAIATIDGIKKNVDTQLDVNFQRRGNYRVTIRLSKK